MSDLINNQSEIYLQQPVVSNSLASGNSYVATGPEYIIHKPLFDDTAANKRAWSLYREFNPIDNQKMDKKLKQLGDDIFVTEKHHMPDINSKEKNNYTKILLDVIGLSFLVLGVGLIIKKLRKK